MRIWEGFAKIGNGKSGGRRRTDPTMPPLRISESKWRSQEASHDQGLIQGSLRAAPKGQSTDLGWCVASSLHERAVTLGIRERQNTPSERHCHTHRR